MKWLEKNKHSSQIKSVNASRSNSFDISRKIYTEKMKLQTTIMQRNRHGGEDGGEDGGWRKGKKWNGIAFRKYSFARAPHLKLCWMMMMLTMMTMRIVVDGGRGSTQLSDSGGGRGWKKQGNLMENHVQRSEHRFRLTLNGQENAGELASQFLHSRAAMVASWARQNNIYKRKAKRNLQLSYYNCTYDIFSLHLHPPSFCVYVCNGSMSGTWSFIFSLMSIHRYHVHASSRWTFFCCSQNMRLTKSPPLIHSCCICISTCISTAFTTASSHFLLPTLHSYTHSNTEDNVKSQKREKSCSFSFSSSPASLYFHNEHDEHDDDDDDGGGVVQWPDKKIGHVYSLHRCSVSNACMQAQTTQKMWASQKKVSNSKHNQDSSCFALIQMSRNKQEWLG